MIFKHEKDFILVLSNSIDLLPHIICTFLFFFNFFLPLTVTLFRQLIIPYSGPGATGGSGSSYTQTWLRGEGPSAHVHEGEDHTRLHI